MGRNIASMDNSIVEEAKARASQHFGHYPPKPKLRNGNRSSRQTARSCSGTPPSSTCNPPPIKNAISAHERTRIEPLTASESLRTTPGAQRVDSTIDKAVSFTHDGNAYTLVDRRLAGMEPESPSSWVLVAMVPFFLTLMVLTHLFFRRVTAPRKPLSRGARIVRKKAPTRIIYEL